MKSFRQLMRMHPRMVALGFGLSGALMLALVFAVGAEIYLRWRDNQVTHEVSVEITPPQFPSTPTSDIVPPQLPESPAANNPPKPPVSMTTPITPSPAPAAIPPIVSETNIDKTAPKIIIPHPTITNEVGELTPEHRKIYYDDKTFGYRHMPNTRGTEVKRSGQKEIYRATYTMDALGRRITPHADGPPPENAVLFIGCSFTFGLGVNDDQTMPWQFALGRPDLAVYNYGVAGYGPQHMLELFKTSVDKEVPQKKAAVVYTLIQEHLNRAVGTPGLVRWFAGPFPWYEIDESTGHPVRKGIFKDRAAQPSNSGLKIVDAVNDYRGESLTSKDAKLMAALIDEARMEFEKKFESEGFYVLVYPGKQTALTNEVVAILKEHGAKILDYRELLAKSGTNWFIAGDGHPSPALHAKVAQKLMEDVLPVSGK